MLRLALIGVLATTVSGCSLLPYVEATEHTRVGPSVCTYMEAKTRNGVVWADLSSGVSRDSLIGFKSNLAPGTGGGRCMLVIK